MTTAPLSLVPHPDLASSAFLLACRREPVPHTPVWFMRQAGRSLPEYRKVRQGIAMLDSCMDPALVTEITLQPVRRYGVDAAIFFSDIVVPLKALGFGVDIVPGVGPVVAQPVRTLADLDRLPLLDPAQVGFVTEAMGLLVRELGATPLIGFAGAPFTLASYLIEGGPSKNHERTKALMYSGDPLWAALLDRLADITLAFLRVQVAAGASAVQLFDSWAGVLSARDYAQYVMPASAKVLSGLADLGVPRIHFGVGTGELLGLMGSAGADVVGVDFRLPLSDAVPRIGPGKAVQGNLDPAVVFAPWDAVATQVRRVLADGRGGRGSRLQPGPRRAAGDRPRGAGPGRRAGPRGDVGMTWVVPAPDEVDGPVLGEDRPILVGYLAWQRATFLHICAGLTAEQLALRPLPSSTLSLQGLVRHLAKVERLWFRLRAAGEEVEPVFPLDLPKDTDFDDGVVADAPAEVERLQAEWLACDDAAAELPFEALVPTRDDEWSLRMVYVHMIGEYARHNGHADLLREAIDGVTAR